MSLFGGIELPGHPDLENVRKLDLLPLPAIGRMQRMGIAIDPEWFRDLSFRITTRMDELRKDICNYIPPETLEEFVSESGDELDFNVNSAPQIAELLFKKLHIGRGLRLKTTKSGSRLSTGKKQLETLKRFHPVIPRILDYREHSKLKSTYTDALPRLARLHNRGTCLRCGRFHYREHLRIHTTILTTRTDTGRLASKRPNLQNIPARSALGREVRKGFIATEGMRLVTADYSQIEMRFLAHCARERNLLRIFEQHLDPHTDTAMRAFGKTYEEVTSDLGKLLYRAPCKNVNFGICYGLQANGLHDLMAVTYATAGIDLPDEIDLDWCADFIDQWFDLYPDAAEYFDLQHYRARRYKIVWTLFGRVRRVPEVDSVHERVQAAGLRQAGNMPIQGVAGDVFKIGMSRAHERFEQYRHCGVDVELLLPVHDELVSEVDEAWSDIAKEGMVCEMSQAMTDTETKELRCRVSVDADGKEMERWTKG